MNKNLVDVVLIANFNYEIAGRFKCTWHKRKFVEFPKL